MRGRRAPATVATVAAGIATVLVAGLPGAAAATAGPARAGAAPDRTGTKAKVDWASCGKKLAAFDCASVEVPTDHDRPRGATTTIALTRLPATSEKQRVGSLFVNFGGPGGPGVATLQQLGTTLFDPAVRARYDLVGFDPRGVGLSDPVTCYPSAEQEAAALARFSAFPVTAAEERRFVTQHRRLAEACVRTSPVRVAHASTANVARDLDVLRDAVGDRKLAYVGYSYGTFLGATYGRLFPDRVGRFVLDGTVDPKAWAGRYARADRTFGMRTGQGPAAARTFTQFLKRCAEAGKKRCALAALGNPRRVVDGTFDRLKNEPVPVPQEDGSTLEVGYDDAVAFTFSALYEPALWSDAAAFLAFLADPDAASRADERAAARAVAAARGVDYASIGNAIAPLCADVNVPTRPGQYPALADRADRAAPDFGRYRAWIGLECEYFPGPDRDRYAGPWQQRSDAKVLVIGTRYDPATPYAFTRPYADLWPNARMLTVEGYGHTIVGKSACGDRRVAAYLVHGTARDGATCRQSVVPFAPARGTAAQEAKDRTLRLLR